MKIDMGRFALRSMVVIMSLFAVIQLIPYGNNHTNPPVAGEPAWDSDTTRALARRACFDCHSNETVWPWYSRVAPFSWLVQNDVDEGRSELNFSEWRNGAKKGESASKIMEEIADGEMPPLMYRLAHPEARLTEQDKKRLADGIAASVGLHTSMPLIVDGESD